MVEFARIMYTMGRDYSCNYMGKLFSSFIALVIFELIIVSQPTLVQAVTPTPTKSPDQAAMVEKVDYILPYPGILPDHPLFPLKQLRDFILERLIIDPVRKIEFYLLQADKRLNMGVFLAEKGKMSLAQDSIAKGEKFMEQAVTTVNTLKREGKEVPVHVGQRLENSMLKHVEVLEEIIAKADEPERSGLTDSLNLVKSLQANFTAQ